MEFYITLRKISFITIYMLTLLSCKTQNTQSTIQRNMNQHEKFSDILSFFKESGVDSSSLTDDYRILSKYTEGRSPKGATWIPTQNPAYWPSALGGFNVRWQTVYPKFIETLRDIANVDSNKKNWNWGVEFCTSNPHICSHTMQQMYFPLVSPETLVLDRKTDSLSPLEKLTLSYLTRKNETNSLVEKIQNGADFPQLTSIYTSQGQAALGREDAKWWGGSCHNLPLVYSLFTKEPKTVKIGQITYYPSDIEALLSFFVNEHSIPYKMIGNRVSYMIHSRNQPIENAYDDINPGALFLTLTNLLGIEKEKYFLVVDKASDQEIWNSRISSYRISSSEIVSRVAAEKLLNKSKKQRSSASPGSFSQSTDQFVHLAFMLYHENSKKPSVHPAIIEIENNRVTGGEWLEESIHNHPDFIWFFQKTDDAPTPKSDLFSHILDIYRQSTL